MTEYHKTIWELSEKLWEVVQPAEIPRYYFRNLIINGSTFALVDEPFKNPEAIMSFENLEDFWDKTYIDPREFGYPFNYDGWGYDDIKEIYIQYIEEMLWNLPREQLLKLYKILHKTNQVIMR